MNVDKQLDKPMNVSERYLYGINIRLNILIEMLSGLIEVYGKQNEIATTSNKVVEEKVEKPKTRKKKKVTE